MKILKFGGTSVGSVESIQSLLQIIRQEIQLHGNPVIVLSAMGGITNLLGVMAENAANGQSYEQELKLLEARHFDVIKAFVDPQRQNPMFTRLKLLFNDLEDILQGVQSLSELTPRTRDLILSYGERCSTFMLSKIAEETIPQALYTDASLLIKTDSSFGQAKVNTELSEMLIQSFCNENSGKVLFVTGFIASNPEGKVTTLGRGGSDYTASIFAAALHADEIQIWTDVNGMMTADPRIVKQAFPLTELSYTEAMELSFFGAKVIYPPTMIPAFLKKIPIVIKNTFQPDFKGTIIKAYCSRSTLPIKGISSINDISILNLQGSGMVGKAGFSGRLFSMLAREMVNVILITQSSSEHSITFAVNPSDALKARQLIFNEFDLEIQARKLDEPVIENDLSALAIVGENMRHTPGIAGRLFHALGRNGVNVRAIAQGSSEYNISVIVSKEDLAKGLNAVHQAFFTQLKKTLNVFCLGTGQIGSTLFKQLHSHSDFLREHNDIQVRIIGISNTRQMHINAEGICLENWSQELSGKGETANLDTFISKMIELNLPNCVLVDNTASNDPIVHYEKVLSSSISVVTCNKVGNSGPYERYRRFKDAARKYGVDFFYETNVGAGLPIVKTLRDLMISGDRVQKIEAILSGTISFIFNNFKNDADFHDIVMMAQEKGFTEPDPRDDLSGMDFMRKMLILARDAGYPLEPHEIEIENLLPAACREAESVEDFYKQLKASASYFNELKAKAEKEAKVLRYIGKLEDGKVAISLQMVDENHPFYMLSGSDNIISFTTDRYVERPMVVKGPGAGAEVTAAGVFADLINVGAE
ncbi:MAG TPA: bifunctional aspartate kinase/homoserine dehydrogenase I [Daejeonella sp.]|nr:bifunctional aspartate kinase/homoserine dehydrogenase I [Daejeonella sp.]